MSRKLIRKVGFIGHRRFLRKKHSYRARKKLNNLFIGGKDENNDPPVKFSAEELEELLENVRNVKPGKPPAAAAVAKKR